MKLAKIIAAAGLTVAAVTMSASADAQNWRDRGNDRHHGWNDRGHHRGWDDRHYGWENRRHYGWNRHHPVCRVTWRHHHRVRVCYR